MRTVLVIGIGAGDPEQLTVQAVNALRGADVFFVLGKQGERQELVELRHEILRRYDAKGRVVEREDPQRDRAATRYVDAVRDWRARRGELCERMIRDELTEGDTGAFLVWGDPALYDSILAVLADIHARGDVLFDYEVIPGISSISALTARHRIGLNRIGRPVQITTGRRLAEGWPEGAQDVVVMLDAHNTFTHYADEDIDIFWGAYLGTPDEILISGKLSEVATRIEQEREQARGRKGWIMDTYLLRRNSGTD